MNMMLDMTTIGMSRDLTTAGAPLSAETAGKGGGMFQSLLARLVGQADGETGAGSMNSAISLMTSVIPLLSASSDEGDLINWLEQLLQQLEQLSEVDLALLQNPEIAAALMSFIGQPMTDGVVPDADSSLRTAEQETSAIRDQLISVIREWIASIRSGDAQAQTAVGQAQAFRQLFESLKLNITPAGQTEGTAAQQGSSFPSALTPSVPAASVHHGLEPQLAKASVAQPQEQPLAESKAVESISTLQATSGITRTALFPKADLLRPELLELALGDSADTVAVESKPGETVTLQTQLTLTQDALKASTDALPLRQPVAQTTQVPVEQFVQHLERFATRSFQITQHNGFAEAKISLVPEHLGQVEIKLTMHNGQLTAQIVTETATGREALEQQLGALRNALQAHGIQVERLEITQQTNAASTFAFLKDQAQQQSARQFQQQTGSRSSGYEEESIDFEEELELIGEYETYYSGRAFHAMA